MNRKKIDNKTFNKAFENLDNLRIMSHAITTSGTTCILSHDELRACKLIALWKSLQTWSEESFPDVKFTTFLFKHVRWQCYFQAHIATRYHRQHKPMVEHADYVAEKEDRTHFSLEDKLAIDEALEKVPNTTISIIEQRFYQQMTLKEIGRANGYSYETARTHIDNAVESIRKLYI